eukprot:g65294.t1
MSTEMVLSESVWWALMGETYDVCKHMYAHVFAKKFSSSKIPLLPAFPQTAPGYPELSEQHYSRTLYCKKLRCALTFCGTTDQI